MTSLERLHDAPAEGQDRLVAPAGRAITTDVAVAPRVGSILADAELPTVVRCFGSRDPSR